MTKIFVVIGFVIMSIIFVSCNNEDNELIVYTSVDRIYSEKIFDMFTEKTGIKVKAVYDVEATKTTGLVNRIISEKDNPVADVFWNGEIIYTMKLKEKGLLEAYESPNNVTLPDKFIDDDGMWTAFGGRGRIIIVNLDKVNSKDINPSITAFAKQSEIYNIGMAKPMFGTTATYVASLYSKFGEEKGVKLFEDIKNSSVYIVDGNGAVRDMVVAGQLDFGLTDTDDALMAVEKGANVDLIFPDQGIDEVGTLIIPNSVAVIKECKHVDQAHRFIDFLLEKETMETMIDIGWFQLAQGKELMIDEKLKPYLPTDGQLKLMDVTFEEIGFYLGKSSLDMTEIFLD